MCVRGEEGVPACLPAGARAQPCDGQALGRAGRRAPVPEAIRDLLCRAAGCADSNGMESRVSSLPWDVAALGLCLVFTSLVTVPSSHGRARPLPQTTAATVQRGTGTVESSLKITDAGS